jgi:hypothetical protein
MAPPSGGDALEVREAYFRRGRLGRSGAWPRGSAWLILGVAVGLLVIASFTVFVVGS